MKKILTQAIIILALLTTISLEAQVTIGSGHPPVSGALLDLKQEADGTSSKGIILPRIELTEIDKLYPMLPNGYNAQENAKHTGLIVYNTNNTGDFCKGIYIWDGSEWKELIEGCFDVKIIPASYQMVMGDTKLFSADMSLLPPTPESISWEVDDTSKGSINSAGLLSANVFSAENGTINVKCIVKNGGKMKEGLALVYISDVFYKLSGVNGVRNLLIGKTDQLTGQIEPSYTPVSMQNVSWNSTNNSVLTVTNGLVTAKAVGTADAIATALGGSGTRTDRCSYNIADVDIALNKTSNVQFIIGQEETLVATIGPSWITAGDKGVVWTSSNPAIATVDATGKVKGIAAGTAVITARATGGSGTKTAACTYTVSAVTLSLNQSTPVTQFVVGRTQQLTATVSPSWISQAVTWSSSSGAATVSSTGLVRGNAAGTATITATVTAAPSIKASVNYTVTALTFSSISLPRPLQSTGGSAMGIAGTQTATAVVSPSWVTTAEKTITWSSSNTSVATINASTGAIVTGNTAGATVITAKLSNGATATATLTSVNCGTNGVAKSRQIGSNTYSTYSYGGKCWMVQNSKEGTYNFRYYENNAGYGDRGAYYDNTQARQSGNACPAGWHLPSVAEGTALASIVNAEPVGSTIKNWWTEASTIAGMHRTVASPNWNAINTQAFYWVNDTGGYRIDGSAATQTLYCRSAPSMVTGYSWSVRCVEN